MLGFAWDLEHGVVVAFRDGATARPRDLWLVVEVQDGPSYFAGTMPKAAGAWAVRAPTTGRFWVSAYAPLDSTVLDQPHAALQRIELDASLRADAEAPARAGERVEARLFRISHDPQGQLAAMVSAAIEVPPEQSPRTYLRSRLAPGDLGSPEQIGIVISRHDGQRQGPATDPFRGRGTDIEVLFTAQPDPDPLPPEAVQLEPFRTSLMPVIEVDLSAFGAAAEDMRRGFWFFHQPLGVAAPQPPVPGNGLAIIDPPDGRRLLRYAFEQGCHRDLIGVHFSGELEFSARNPLAGDACGLPEHFSNTRTAAALVAWPEYLPLPDQAAQIAARAATECPSIDMEALQRRRFCTWIEGDPSAAWFRPDLTGAATGNAATLFAYLHLLRWLRREDAGAERLARSRLQMLGIEAGRFRGFAEHPDLALAVLADPDVVAWVSRVHLDTPCRSTRLSPLARLVAAAEPTARMLPDWCERLPQPQQYVAWRLLLGGVALDPLFQQNLVLDEVVARPADLTANLARLADEGRRRAAVETLRDLGESLAPLASRKLARLSEIEPAALDLLRAEAAFEKEFEDVGRLLVDAHLPPGVDAKAAREQLLSDQCPSREELVAQVRALAADIRISGPALPHGSSRLRTRHALLMLLRALEGFDQIQRSAGPLYRWMRDILRGGVDVHLDPRATGNELTPTEQHGIDEELNAFEDQVTALARLPRGLPPAWSGARAEDQAAVERSLQAACDSARDWIEGRAAAATGDGHHALLALVERVRSQQVLPWIAARAVWSQRVGCLLAHEPAADSVQAWRQLRARCTSPPSDWEEVAAAIDRLCGRPPRVRHPLPSGSDAASHGDASSMAANDAGAGVAVSLGESNRQ